VAAPAIACDGGNVYVVWSDDRDGKSDIFLRRSGDAGTTWGGDQRLDVGDAPGASWSGEPQVACDGDRVYAIWTDSRDGHADLYFNRSLDRGAVWLASDTRLDRGDAPGATDSYWGALCCEGTNVYVTWTDDRDGEDDIYFNRSRDAGQTWLAADVRLDRGDPPGAAWSWWPAICCDGDRVYVVWRDARALPETDVYFNRSLDGGGTWLPTDVRLDAADPPGAHRSWWPDVCCDGLEVYVAWADDRVGARGTYLNASFDGGTTWLPAERRIGPNAEGRTADARCLLDASWLVVGWTDVPEGPGAIRVNRAPR
jgi:hypothetical protein